MTSTQIIKETRDYKLTMQGCESYPYTVISKISGNFRAQVDTAELGIECLQNLQDYEDKYYNELNLEAGEQA